MLDTCRLASYEPKGKEKQAMKQQKKQDLMLINVRSLIRNSMLILMRWLMRW